VTPTLVPRWSLWLVLWLTPSLALTPTLMLTLTLSLPLA